MSRKPLILLVIGLVVGAASTQLVATAHAGGGAWKCYVVDRLPDPTKAQDWRGAQNVSEGLNKVAPNAASGTLLTVQYPTATGGFASAQSDVGLICSKD